MIMLERKQYKWQTMPTPNLTVVFDKKRGKIKRLLLTQIHIFNFSLLSMQFACVFVCVQLIIGRFDI